MYGETLNLASRLEDANVSLIICQNFRIDFNMLD